VQHYQLSATRLRLTLQPTRSHRSPCLMGLFKVTRAGQKLVAQEIVKSHCFYGTA
jgi:hypothetical protein